MPDQLPVVSVPSEAGFVSLFGAGRGHAPRFTGREHHVTVGPVNVWVWRPGDKFGNGRTFQPADAADPVAVELCTGAGPGRGTLQWSGSGRQLHAELLEGASSRVRRSLGDALDETRLDELLELCEALRA